MRAERLYTALMWLYPKSFRQQYATAMLEAFADLRASRRLSHVAFWRFVVVDVLRSAVRQQLNESRTGSRCVGLRWLATCALGLLATTLAAHTVGWVFSYFSHPYLEDIIVPAWGYGACLGLVLGGTIAVSQRLLLPTYVGRAGAWALASAMAVPVAVPLCGAVVKGTLTGFHPVPADPYADALAILLGGVHFTVTWIDIAVPLVVMAVSGFAVSALMTWTHRVKHHGC